METAEIVEQLKVAADLCRANGHLKAEEACNAAAELIEGKHEKPAKKK